MQQRPSNAFSLLAVGLLLAAAPGPLLAKDGAVDPATTYGVLVGVLRWEEDAMNSFSPVDRQDRQLYQTLRDLGGPGEQLTLLLDEEATLGAIRAALAQAAARAPAGSTFQLRRMSSSRSPSPRRARID